MNVYYSDEIPDYIPKTEPEILCIRITYGCHVYAQAQFCHPWDEPGIDILAVWGRTKEEALTALAVALQRYTIT